MKVVAIINLSSPDQKNELISMLSQLGTQVRLERGCLIYEIFSSGSRRIVICEEWSTPETLADHANGPLFANLTKKLKVMGLQDSLQVLPLEPAGLGT